MDKVYIVTTCKGSWSEWTEITVGVYTSMWDAEKGREEYIMRLKEHQSRYSKKQIKALDIECNHNQDEDDKWPKYLSDYWEWKYSQPMDYSEQVDIEEIEINKILHTPGQP